MQRNNLFLFSIFLCCMLVLTACTAGKQPVKTAAESCQEALKAIEAQNPLHGKMEIYVGIDDELEHNSTREFWISEDDLLLQTVGDFENPSGPVVIWEFYAAEKGYSQGTMNDPEAWQAVETIKRPAFFFKLNLDSARDFSEEEVDGFKLIHFTVGEEETNSTGATWSAQAVTLKLDSKNSLQSMTVESSATSPDFEGTYHHKQIAEVLSTDAEQITSVVDAQKARLP